MIKAVIFDMDGVLIDSENLWQEAEKALWAEQGIDLTPAHLHQSRGLVTAEMVDHWSDYFGVEADRKALMSRYDRQMVTRFRNEVPLMDGAREAIAFFKSRGLPLALASCSTHEHIDAAMDRHQLGQEFDLVVSAAGRMPGKPHPEIYLHTAEKLGVIPTTCLAIEDSFFGLISARAARMKVISMPDPHEFEQARFSAADAKIRSLREIDEALFQKLAAL